LADEFLLVGDLGGTHARFAMVERNAGGLQASVTMPCAGFSSATQALEAYLEQTGRGQPRFACLAVAGVVNAGSVQFLNSDWQLHAAQLASRLGSEQVLLLNDFEAVARALPQLAGNELLAVGAALPAPDVQGDFSVAVLGPGTGLGVSGLVQRGGAAVALSGEGGHGGFAPESAMQAELLVLLRARFGRVSNERLLSGPGIENMFVALQKLHGLSPSPLSAEAIFAAATGPGAADKDTVAAATVGLFCELLGQVAGDLALTLGARDGVYIAGGMLRRYPALLTASGFRAGFENKGRHRGLMESIPTALVTHPSPALLGAGAVVRQLAAGAA
jgi:glucokinase